MKGFIDLNKSWFFTDRTLEKDVFYSFIIGDFDNNSDNHSVFSIDLNFCKLNDKISAIQLSSYNDSWKIFTKYPDLFEKLSSISDDNTITPDDVTKILISLGFKNFTQTER